MISRTERVTTYAVLILFSVVVVIPVALLILTALSPKANGGLTPTDLHWGNFITAWQRSDFGHHLGLSLILASTTTLATIVIAPLAAYGIAILQVPGHKVVFILFLAGIMIPLEGIIVPLYFTMRSTPFASTIGSLVLAQV